MTLRNVQPVVSKSSGIGDEGREYKIDRLNRLLEKTPNDLSKEEIDSLNSLLGLNESLKNDVETTLTSLFSSAGFEVDAKAKGGWKSKFLGRNLLSSMSSTVLGGLTNNEQIEVGEKDSRVEKKIKELGNSFGKRLNSFGNWVGANQATILLNLTKTLTNDYQNEVSTGDLFESIMSQTVNMSGILTRGKHAAFVNLAVQTKVCVNTGDAVRMFQNAHSGDETAIAKLNSMVDIVSHGINNIITIAKENEARLDDEKKATIGQVANAIRADHRKLGAHKIARDGFFGAIFTRVISPLALAARVSRNASDAIRNLTGGNIDITNQAGAELLAKDIKDNEPEFLEVAKMVFGDNVRIESLDDKKKLKVRNKLISLIKEQLEQTEIAAVIALKNVSTENIPVNGIAKKCIKNGLDYLVKNFGSTVDSQKILVSLAKQGFIENKDDPEEVENQDRSQKELISEDLNTRINKLTASAQLKDVKGSIFNLKELATYKRILSQAGIAVGKTVLVTAAVNVFSLELNRTIANWQGKTTSYSEILDTKYDFGFEEKKWSGDIKLLNQFEAIIRKTEADVEILKNAGEYTFDSLTNVLTSLKEGVIDAFQNPGEAYQAVLRNISFSRPAIAGEIPRELMIEKLKEAANGQKNPDGSVVVKLPSSDGSIRSFKIHKLDQDPKAIMKALEEGLKGAPGAVKFVPQAEIKAPNIVEQVIVAGANAHETFENAQNAVHQAMAPAIGIANDLSQRVDELPDKLTVVGKNLTDSILNPQELDLNPNSVENGIIGMPSSFKFDLVEGETSFYVLTKGGGKVFLNSPEVIDFINNGGKPADLPNQSFFGEALFGALKENNVGLDKIDKNFLLYMPGSQLGLLSSQAEAAEILRKSGILEKIINNDITREFNSSPMFTNDEAAIREILEQYYGAVNNVSGKVNFDELREVQDIIRALRTGVGTENLNEEELKAYLSLRKGFEKALPNIDEGLTPHNILGGKAMIAFNSVEGAIKARQDVVAEFINEFNKFDRKFNYMTRLSNADRVLLERFQNAANDGIILPQEDMDKAIKIIAGFSDGKYTQKVANDFDLRDFGEQAISKLAENNKIIYERVAQSLEEQGFTFDPEKNVYWAVNSKGERLEISNVVDKLDFKQSASIFGIKFTQEGSFNLGEGDVESSIDVNPMELASTIAGFMGGQYTFAGKANQNWTRLNMDVGIAPVFDKGMQSVDSILKANPEGLTQSQSGMGYRFANFVANINNTIGKIPPQFPGSSLLNKIPLIGFGKEESFGTVLGDTLRIGDTADIQLGESTTLAGLSNINAAILNAFGSNNPDAFELFDGSNQYPVIKINESEYSNMTPIEAMKAHIHNQTIGGLTRYDIFVEMGDKKISITPDQLISLQELEQKLADNPELARAVIYGGGIENATNAGTSVGGLDGAILPDGGWSPIGISATAELQKILDYIPESEQQRIALAQLQSFYDQSQKDIDFINSRTYNENIDSFKALLDRDNIPNVDKLASITKGMINKDLAEGQFEIINNADGSSTILVNGKQEGVFVMYGRDGADFFEGNVTRGSIATITLTPEETARFIQTQNGSDIINAETYNEISQGKRIIVAQKDCQGNGGVIAPVEANVAIKTYKEAVVTALTSNNGQVEGTVIGSSAPVAEGLEKVGGQFATDPVLKLTQMESESLRRINNAFGNINRSAAMARFAFEHSKNDPNFDIQAFVFNNITDQSNVNPEDVIEIYNLAKQNPDALAMVNEINFAGSSSSYEQTLQFALKFKPTLASEMIKEKLPGTDWSPHPTMPGYEVRLLDGEKVEIKGEGLKGSFRVTMREEIFGQTLAVKTTVEQGPDGVVKLVTPAGDVYEAKEVLTVGGGFEFESTSERIDQKVAVREGEDVTAGDKGLSNSTPSSQAPGISDAPNQGVNSGDATLESSSPTSTGPGVDGTPESNTGVSTDTLGSSTPAETANAQSGIAPNPSATGATTDVPTSPGVSEQGPTTAAQSATDNIGGDVGLSSNPTSTAPTAPAGGLNGGPVSGETENLVGGGGSVEANIGGANSVTETIVSEVPDATVVTETFVPDVSTESIPVVTETIVPQVEPIPVQMPDATVVTDQVDEVIGAGAQSLDNSLPINE